MLLYIDSKLVNSSTEARQAQQKKGIGIYIKYGRIGGDKGIDLFIIMIVLKVNFFN